MRQEIKDQIRKITEEKYPPDAWTEYHRIHIATFGEAVMERLDIDEAKFGKIKNALTLWEYGELSKEQAKQAILDAIRISG